MKAAVMYPNDSVPGVEEVPVPMAENNNEIVVRVRAAALKQLDRGRAAGTHYSAEPGGQKGRVIGGDGVCLLPDGSRVYAIGVGGMMAEQAAVYKERIVALPDKLSDSDAAALANAVIGSAMALRFKARIKTGDCVLINGATGFTGRIAVQIAKYYGAGRVIATGRNERCLRELAALGADETLSLSQPEEAIAAELRAISGRTPFDVVIDYLWGKSAELILAGFKGNGRFTREIRYVSVGSVSGDSVGLSAAGLRSVNLQLSGSGLGSWSEEAVAALFKEILPEMFQLAAEGKLKMKTSNVKLEDLPGIWNVPVPDGGRIVVVI